MATKIQLRRGTAQEWTTANPVLAEGEPGIEKDTGLVKYGNGVDAWNALPYRPVATVPDVLTLTSQANHPAIPGVGTLKAYAKTIAGRAFLRVLGPSGLKTPLQPALFQNTVRLVTPNTTTSMTAIGGAITSVGTLSTPTPTEQLGFMTNFASAATALITTGTGDALFLWTRGTVPGGSNGFFISIRAAFPDASYDSTGAGVGTRAFVGLYSGTMSSSVLADDIAAAGVGFQRLHTDTGLKDSNWFIVTRNAGPQVRLNTGIPFAAGKIMDFYLFTAPLSNVINWRIDNLSDGTSAEGVLSNEADLPPAGTPMRAGIQLQTVDAVVRNVRLGRLYGEADR